MRITEEQAETFAYYSFGSDWRQVSDEIIDQGRWHTHHRKVLEFADGTFWDFRFSLGSTEMQDDREFDGYLTQVYPHKVERIIYSTEPPE